MLYFQASQLNNFVNLRSTAVCVISQRAQQLTFHQIVTFTKFDLVNGTSHVVVDLGAAGKDSLKDSE